MQNSAIKIALKVSGIYRLKKDERISETIAAIADELQCDTETIESIYMAEIDARARQRIERIRRRETLPVSAGTNTVSTPIHAHNGPVVVTAAQNNTDINRDMLAVLRNYCETRDAQLVIAPMLYNKSAFAQPDNSDGESVWFDPAIVPYLHKDKFSVHGVTVLCGAHVLPTAKYPLSGFEGAATESIVVPASTIQLKTLARLKDQKLRVMYSTGAVTGFNYIQRKAGTVAELNHCFSATVIEPDGRMRALTYQDGAIYDCIDGSTTRYTADSIERGNVSALILGDIHAEKMSADRRDAIIDLQVKMVPRYTVLHDLLDFSSRNHHNRGSSLFIFNQLQNNNTVASDLNTAIDFIAQLQGNVVVVDSNHDRALTRWLDEADYRADPVNAITFLELQLTRYKMADSENWNPLEYWYRHAHGKVNSSIRFLKPDESFRAHGIELGNHGDRGPNGSRGYLQGFRAIGASMVIGHSHSPGIAGAVYQVGVSGNLDMGYNVGPSSWAHAHCVVFDNGTRQIVFE